MTRKDYIALAAALREARILPHGNKAQDMARDEQWNRCLVEVCDVLASDNARFDRHRFVRAAGVES